MNPRKVLAHHLGQWSRGFRPVESKFKAIKITTNSAGNGNEPGHAVALYVNNFLVARGRGRTIHAAQEAACTKALQCYGMKFT